MSTRIKKYFSDRNQHFGYKSLSKQNFSLIKRKSFLPWVELKNLEVPAKKLFQEYLKAKDVSFYKHRQESLNKGWFAHTLYGYGEDKTLGYLHYRHLKHKRRWSLSIKYFPEIHQFVKTLPYTKLYEVRLLLLEPGRIYLSSYRLAHNVS